MPLKLVTGPANSGRAGAVLGAYRARLADEPILVVPGYRDVEHSLRELADAGAVFGAHVMRFGRLFDEFARRCGAPRARRVSELERRVLLEEAVGSLELDALSGSAGQPGFTRAALALVRELGRSLVEPGDLEGALGGHGGAHGRHLAEAVSIYRAYRERLERSGRVDDEQFAWRAIDALRERPHRFGRTPVFVYGFDDFTAVELDALDALADRAGVELTVSLPYEAGRAAFRAIAPVFERLRSLASEHVALEAVADFYDADSRAALHGLERGLYEGSSGTRLDPAGAVRLLSAGGERAEAELVAAGVLRLLRSGTPAGEVAVVYRDPRRYATLVEQVFGAYGVPYSLDRYVPLAHTSLGRGVLALLRCLTPAGTVDDVLAYLRTPGVVELPRVVDRVEEDLRRAGVRTARQAQQGGLLRIALGALDRLRGAGEGAGLLAELVRELDHMFASPYARRAPRFSGDELDDPRVWTQLQAAISELRGLSASGARLDAQRVHNELAALEVRLGEDARPDRVQVAAPEAIRARRFEAVFVCGLQEGEFPRSRGSEPFLSDSDRRAIAEAGGPRLVAREDEIDRERHLFYVCCSRAERELFLSARFADEEGTPQVGSFLLEEVRDLFDESLGRAEIRRSLADVTWEPELAPTEVELGRALALAGPRREQAEPDGLHDPGALASLAGEHGLSASALEAFADCPVRWLVDRLLRPQELAPDPEPLVRGSYAHAVLEATYRRLHEESGSARVRGPTLALAEQILLEELDAKRAAFPISPREARARTAVRKLEFDLLRHLRREAEADTAGFEPTELELSFGGDGLGPLRVGADRVAIRGRIDRVDVRDKEAIVVDYKSGKNGYPVARWEPDNRLQVALYMLAVRELLGLEPVGGLYVPLADPKGGPRGLLLQGAVAGGAFKKQDLRPREEFEAALERARERVGELAARMRSGEVRPCPETCAWNGGCSHPSICRVEQR
ncbi:MAG: hypothetical protein NVSMB25_05070 [Thermoleophilaceae bacterium]